MWTILETVLPVFALMILGIALRKGGLLDVPMEKALNVLCYWVLLPVFLTWNTAIAPALDASALRGVAAMMIVVFLLLFLGITFIPLLHLPERSRGTFLQACFRSNNAYVGIPIITFALTQIDADLLARGLGLAAVILTPSVLLYNFLGVLVLEWDRRHTAESHPFKTWIRGTFKNPLVMGCLLGLLWNILPIPAPPLIGRIVTPLGAAAFPLALLAIGARIASLPLHHFGKNIAGLILIKNVLPIPVAFWICRLLNVDEISTLVVLVMSACPTAVASYVLVDQLDGDRDLGAAAIAATTALSVFSLVAALWAASLY
ncbi:MAG: AEC family transporter [Verrucomicrobia bacterium]|nr:AEC family transporter [Verrucomicrobiota bacterium]MCH8526548.1 AEC family transporter [Kiritimatiellia bacterium]